VTNTQSASLRICRICSLLSQSRGANGSEDAIYHQAGKLIDGVSG